MTFMCGSIYEATLIMNRSSHLEVFCKKGVLRKFIKFTRKHLCRSVVFNKVASLHPVALLKKTSATGIFKSKLFLNMSKYNAASKCNVTFKELFSFIHRTLKRKRCLNMLFTVNLFFYVKVVF